MLGIIQVLVLALAIYVAYSIIYLLKEIKELLQDQKDQNEQIIDLLERQYSNQVKW